MTEQNVTHPEWDNAQAAHEVQRKNPHERLNEFAKAWAAREASLGEWGEWSKFVEERLLKLLDKMLPDMEQARVIEESMQAAGAVQSAKSADMATLQEEIANIRSDIANDKKRMAEIAAEALMFAEGSNAAKQKAAAAQVLKNDNEYQKLKEALATNEREKLIKQAHYDSAAREYERLKEQLRNLRVRLQHWTARARMTQGE